MAEWKKVVVSGSQAELNSLTLDTALVGGSGGTGLLQTALTAGSVGDTLILNANKTGFELATDAGGDVTTAELNASSSAIRANMTLATASIAALVVDSASFSTRVTAAGDVTTAELNASSSAIRANMTIATASIAALVVDSASFSTRFASTGDVTTAMLNASSSAIRANMTIATASIAALVVDSASFSTRFASTGDVTTAELNASSSTLQSNIDGKLSLAGGTVTGNLVVEGDSTFGTDEADKTVINGALVVNGTASFAHADNLAIADKYILINSGSTGTGDGGLVVQTAGSNGIGELVGFDANVTGRWGITSSFNAQTTADFVPSAFMGVVVTDTEDDPVSSTKAAAYTKAGNMYIDTNAGSEGIWIYN
jgi:hypothetical protein